jgi:hypothetical protein
MITRSFVVRALAVASALAIASPLACGGQATGGPGGASGSGSGGGAGSGGSSGSSGGSGGDTGTGGIGGSGGTSGTVGGAGGSTGTGGDGGTCVDIALSDYDTSCTTASDCVEITAGTICTGGCECGGAAINIADQSKYDAAIASIKPGICGCPTFGMPACIKGTCTLCLSGTTPGCGDGGVPPFDGGSPDTGVIFIEAGSGETGVTTIEAGSFSLSCLEVVGSNEVCYSYEGLTASTATAEKSACASAGGKVVSTCPTAGLSGCCEDIPVGGSSITYGYCEYGVPASGISALKSACASAKGTWSM